MVSHCANPECRAPFVYFREGRLIAITGRIHHEHVEFFWFCGRCAKHMALPAADGILPLSARNDLDLLMQFQSRAAALSQN